MMRRAQIRLDEATYALARQRASAEGISFAAFVRKALEQQLAPEICKRSNQNPRTDNSKPVTTEGFSFIGMGRSDQGDLSPVSERHDEALEEAFGRH